MYVIISNSTTAFDDPDQYGPIGVVAEADEFLAFIYEDAECSTRERRERVTIGNNTIAIAQVLSDYSVNYSSGGKTVAVGVVTAPETRVETDAEVDDIDYNINYDLVYFLEEF